jgi:hypothetical protein
MASNPTKRPSQDHIRSSTPNALTTTIYRVEDAGGYGYKRSLCRTIGSLTCVEWRGYEERRPLPDDDGIDFGAFGEEWFFAFESIDSLNSWFRLNERNAGTTAGGQIMIIEVDPQYIVRGGRQVIFHQDHSKTIGSVPMNHFDSEEDRAVPFDDEDEIEVAAE